MWEEILSRAQREAELRRDDSVDTVSTVETFVSSSVSELGRVEAGDNNWPGNRIIEET